MRNNQLINYICLELYTKTNRYCRRFPKVVCKLRTYYDIDTENLFDNECPLLAK